MLDMLTYYQEKLANNKEIFIKIKVVFNAKKAGLFDIMADDTVKISLAAAPEKGKANQELIGLLAEKLGVRKYQVQIVSGASDRQKLVKVSR